MSPPNSPNAINAKFQRTVGEALAERMDDTITPDVIAAVGERVMATEITIVSISYVAEAIGRNPQTVTLLVQRGELPNEVLIFQRAGQPVRVWLKDEVDEFAYQRRLHPPKSGPKPSIEPSS